MLTKTTVRLAPESASHRQCARLCGSSRSQGPWTRVLDDVFPIAATTYIAQSRCDEKTAQTFLVVV